MVKNKINMQYFNLVNLKLNFTDDEIKLIFHRLGYELKEETVEVSKKIFNWWREPKYKIFKYTVTRIFDKNGIEVLNTSRMLNSQSADYHDWSEFTNFKWPRKYFEMEILQTHFKSLIFPFILDNNNPITKNEK